LDSDKRPAQEIAWNLGGTVAKCDHREYGSARIQINKLGSDQSSVDALFEGLGDDMEVRAMSLYVDSQSSR
jgi:GMP synthase (glutamine-hydrolysing)